MRSRFAFSTASLKAGFLLLSFSLFFLHPAALSAPSKTASKSSAKIGSTNDETRISELTKAIKIKPNDDYLYLLRAHHYLNQKRYDQAITDLTSSIKVKPTAAAYLARAKVLFDKGQFKASIVDSSKVIELDQKQWIAYEIRANCYLKNGPYESSTQDWKKAIALNPKLERLRVGLAASLARAYEHEAEVEALTDAFKAGMKGKELYRLRADALYKDEKYAEAAEDLTRVLDDYKSDKWERWDLYKLRARANLRSKQFLKAEKDCTEALLIAPDDSKTYYCRADVRDHMGKFKEAIDDLNTTIKFDPQNGRAYSMRAKIYEHLGDKRKAAADRASALKLGDQQWGI